MFDLRLLWQGIGFFVPQIKTKQFYGHIMQELGKNREIQLNQQTIRCQVLA